MPRVARIVVAGQPHPITQRGNNRQDLFFVDEARWRVIRDKGADEGFAEAFHRNTHTGRPLGSDSFLSKLEQQLGRRVRALPVGRPR